MTAADADPAIAAKEAKSLRDRAADKRKRSQAAWERPLDVVDVVMLVLAVFSVGLLLYVTFIDTSQKYAAWVFVVDTTICGVFAVEFLWRWRKAGWQRWYPLAHWYDVLGMIPIAHPALRGLRLIRVLLIAVRVARMTYRIFGEGVTNRLVDQLTDPVVEAIKRPVIVMVLDEVVRVVETGNIPLGMAAALRENSDELEQLVVDKLNADPTAGRLALLPFSDRITRMMIETTLRVLLEVLADPRLDEFFTDVIKRNQERIRDGVLERLETE